MNEQITTRTIGKKKYPVRALKLVWFRRYQKPILEIHRHTHPIIIRFD
jgi:hypothetical protein